MPLLPLVLLACLAVGLYAAVEGLRDRPPGRGLLRGLLALQALLLVQAAVEVPGLLDGSTATHAGYLLLTVLLLPGAVALTLEERTRYGTLVLGVGALVVAVVELRLQATA